jgi:phage tail-like protein
LTHPFLVEIDGTRAGGFAEVSGLSGEAEPSAPHPADDPQLALRKVPGLHKLPSVTLKRGVAHGATLSRWHEGVLRGRDDRREVTVVLLDESGAPAARWRLHGARIDKLEGPTLNAKGGTDIAIESLVLTPERISLDS